MASLERAMVVSYRLSIVTIAVSAFCNHSAAICDRISPILKSTVGGPNLGVFPLEHTRRVGVANSKRSMLTNGEIIFEEF